MYFISSTVVIFWGKNGKAISHYKYINVVVVDQLVNNFQILRKPQRLAYVEQILQQLDGKL